MTKKSYSIATIEIAGELNVLPPPVECSPDGNSCLFSQSNRPRFREEAENLIIKNMALDFPVTEPGRSGARRGKRNHYGDARARDDQCAFRSSVCEVIGGGYVHERSEAVGMDAHLRTK